MKKIIIAIDYNNTANKIAAEGYAIAKALQADIILVHVITEPAYYAMDYSPIADYSGNYTDGTVAIFKDIKDQAIEFLNSAAKNLADNTIKTKVLTGDGIDDSLLAFCKTENADMIITGSHSHKGLERIFVTDVAAHLLKHSKIPLLIIPTAGENIIINN